MNIWFIVQWADEDMRSVIECQRHDMPTVGFIDDFKRAVRTKGGRVLAVVRPKRDLARELNAITGLCRVSD